jgi:hypothetical protein
MDPGRRRGRASRVERVCPKSMGRQDPEAPHCGYSNRRIRPEPARAHHEKLRRLPPLVPKTHDSGTMSRRRGCHRLPSLLTRSREAAKAEVQSRALGLGLLRFHDDEEKTGRQDEQDLQDGFSLGGWFSAPRRLCASPSERSCSRQYLKRGGRGVRGEMLGRVEHRVGRSLASL